MKYYNKRHLYMDVVDTNYTNILVGKLISSAKLKKNQNILEIGCGKGRFSMQLLKRGYKLTCLDNSESMLREFKSIANSLETKKDAQKSKISGTTQGGFQSIRQKPDKNVKLVKGDFNVVYKKYKEKFDAVIGFYILHHFKNLEHSLSNIMNVLKRGGIAAFIEPNPYNPMYYAQLLLYKDMNWNEEKGIINVNPKKLLKIFTKNGFKNFQLKRFGFLPPFLMNLPIGMKIDTMLERFKPFYPIRPYQLIIAKR